MKDNYLFSIVKRYDFSLNYRSLYDLYLPIIGNKGINFYISLLNEADKIIFNNIQFNEINEFLKTNKLSIQDFYSIRLKLEAIGLINTYYDSSQNKYWYQLNEPLKFDQFINNQKLRHLLIREIGIDNYEKLEYTYNNNHYPRNIVDITVKFDQVFHDEEIKSIYEFNFEQLYANVSLKTHTNIVLDELTKKIIESYFKNYNLNLNEIEHVLYQSFLKNQDNQFYVDTDLLNLNFKKYVTNTNNLNVFKQVSINRNTKMFYENLDKNEIENIFSSYRSLNSEQYYSAIKKTALTNEEKSIISILRKTYALDDSIINLMIDFSLTKTNGKLNRLYLTKMAQTANALNLLELGNLYAYLSKGKSTSNNHSYQPKYEDDPEVKEMWS